MLADFLYRGYRRITYDQEFTSAKKRRAQGRLDILDDGVELPLFSPTEEQEEFLCQITETDAENEEADTLRLLKKWYCRSRRWRAIMHRRPGCYHNAFVSDHVTE